jgi:arginine N-succinyltransferase
MFVVRAAGPDDFDDVQRLAAKLDTVNLPDDPDAIRRLLDDVRSSFDGTSDAPELLFALEEVGSRRVIGLSMILAQHGTPQDPHHYYKLDVDERYSRSLGTVHRHQTLQFKRSFTPHTEIGALILDPEFRGHPAKLGKLLSFARFLYIAAFRDRFCATVQAELLPPFEEDGSSRLWNWLGRKFTGLDYLEADRLSRENQEFMQALFPPGFIYTSLMPEEVQAIIGSVGEQTRGVAAMLRSAGFAFNNHIDPFDGGPHYECVTDDITIVRDAGQSELIVGEPDGEIALVGLFPNDGAAPRVTTAAVTADGEGRSVVSAETLSLLGGEEGAVGWTSPLPLRGAS